MGEAGLSVWEKVHFLDSLWASVSSEFKDSSFFAICSNWRATVLYLLDFSVGSLALGCFFSSYLVNFLSTLLCTIFGF